MLNRRCRLCYLAPRFGRRKPTWKSTVAKSDDKSGPASRGRAVGRPRASAAPASADARADIIAAAAKLFRLHGIAGASVREIAADAGLKKASLYYYFTSKDEIVYAMIEDVLGPALATQKKLGMAPLSEAARLFLYLRADIELLCAASYDCTWLLNHGDLGDARMKAYARQRKKLVSWLVARLKEGMAKGEFAPCDATTAAQALLAATEYSVTWAERHDRGRIAATAAEVATLLTRGVLAGGRSVEAVKAEVAAFPRS